MQTTKPDEVTTGRDLHICWQPGDRCRVHLEPLHEGPHPDDQYDDRDRYRTIVEVHRHPNNPTWVQEFTVRDDRGNVERIPARHVAAYVYPEGHVF